VVVSAPAQLPRIEEAGVSAGVLLFATLATFSAVVFFGLMPAFLAARGDGGLRDDDGRSAGSRRARRIAWIRCARSGDVPDQSPGWETGDMIETLA
jgi:hypothetical protein